MKQNTIISQRIKEKRQELHMTQKDLAEAANVAMATISAYENGAKCPSLDIVINIAKVFDVSIDWLCGNDTHDTKIKNMGDVIKILNELSNEIQFDIDFGEYYKPSIKHNAQNARLCFKQEYIINFLSRWKKIKESYDQGVIDEELYSRWLEKEIEEQTKIIIK